jgi:hypothetical protein
LLANLLIITTKAGVRLSFFSFQGGEVKETRILRLLCSG